MQRKIEIQSKKKKQKTDEKGGDIPKMKSTKLKMDI